MKNPTLVRIITLPPDHPAKFIERKFGCLNLLVTAVVEEAEGAHHTEYVAHVRFTDLLEALKKARLYATVDWCRTNKHRLRDPLSSHIVLRSEWLKVVSGPTCFVSGSLSR